MTVILRAFARGKPTDRDALVVDLGFRVIERWGLVACFGPIAFRAVSALVCAAGALSLDDLAEAAWGDCPDGGPEFTARNLWRHISTARAALAPLGVVVAVERQKWYRARILAAPASQADRESAMLRPGNSTFARERRKAEAVDSA